MPTLGIDLLDTQTGGELGLARTDRHDAIALNQHVAVFNRLTDHGVHGSSAEKRRLALGQGQRFGERLVELRHRCGSFHQAEGIPTAEFDLAIHHGPLDAGEDRQRIPIEQHQVGVFAYFDRSDTVLDAQLLGGIERHQLERFHRVHVRVAHRFGGFGVQSPHHLVAIGIDRSQHAGLGHQRRVLGDRIVRFDLVSPPIGEGRPSHARFGHLMGHLVALQDVLERGDLEPEALRGAQQHQDFVGAVAVAVHVDGAFEDADQSIQAQVLARRARIFPRSTAAR